MTQVNTVVPMVIRSTSETRTQAKHKHRPWLTSRVYRAAQNQRKEMERFGRLKYERRACQALPVGQSTPYKLVL